MRLTKSRGAALSLAFAAGGMVPAWAEDLTIGVRASTASVDPHYFSQPQNFQVSLNMFEQLVANSPTEEIIPALATEWQPIDDDTWEFKLREGVLFHDGSEFTAEDVAFSVERVREGSGPITFSGFVEYVDSVEIVDDHTIHIHTSDPTPTLLNDLTSVLIVSKDAAEGATVEDFDSGEATIGTGPYQFVSYTPGEVVELEAFSDYWGGTPAWDNVTIRTIPDDAAREVALLAGDVDVIENPPIQDFERLQSDGFEIAQGRLGPGRIHHCMRTIGAAERALELLVKRAMSREAFGKPVIKHSIWEHRIAKARIDIEMARLLTLKAAWMMDTVGNKHARGEIAMIKVAAPHMALQVIDDAIQAHGGGGVSSDFPLAYSYAGIRTLRLADGPDEVHERTIARLEAKRHLNL